MAALIQSLCGVFLAFALFLALLDNFNRRRPRPANADGPPPSAPRGGRYSGLFGVGVLISVVLLLLPLDRLLLI